MIGDIIVIVAMLAVLATIGVATWVLYPSLRYLYYDWKHPPVLIDEVPQEVVDNLRKALNDSRNVSVTIKADFSPVMAGFARIGAAMQQATSVFAQLGAAVERVEDSRAWTVSRPYINYQDIWIGAYWKQEDISDLTDMLSIYICLVPCVVIELTRVRCYSLVPRVDTRINPVCLECDLPHSEHNGSMLPRLDPVAQTQCNGKFIF